MARREFQFVEGTSSKFWAIELSGVSFTVNWGRIGTGGQTQTKEFASDGEAKKQYDKLVAEKVKKGYAEVGATAGAASVPAAVAGSRAAKPSAKKAAEPKAEPALAAVPAPVASVAVNLGVERSIGLSPEDWHTAVWRERKPLPRPEAKPFDLADCAARLSRVSTQVYGWQWQWDEAGLSPAMAPEEAHFWLTAMNAANNKVKPKALAEKLAQGKYHKLRTSEAEKLVRPVRVRAEIVVPLYASVPLGELVEMLLVPMTSRNEQSWVHDPAVMFGMRRYILPYLTDGEIKLIRQAVAGKLDAKDWPVDHSLRPPGAFYLAAMVGFPEELLRVTRNWKDDTYVLSGYDHTYYHNPQLIVLGLGEARLVETEMRRHKLPLNQPEYMRGWLATTGYAALDYARDCILAITNREECEKLIEVLCLVKAPEAAPHMLELKLSSKAPKLARQWLDENVGCAIAGLVETAGGRGRLADAAIEYLRDAKRGGHEKLIREAMKTNAVERVQREVLDHVEKVYAPFDEKSTPKWLADAMKQTPAKGKVPAWVAPAALPPVAVGGNRLNDQQLAAALGALQASTAESPHALVKALRENGDSDALDAFAWRLFELWLAEGAPSKDKWAMGAIGLLGSDTSVLKLTPMIRNWPGESQHPRAVFGLECLRAVGSDTALMCLNGIAQKLKFKGLKTKAMELMEAIATGRNMTRAQLEDRIVPDCDLDERGTRLFDFGQRQFRFVLGPDMKPAIKDADGKVKSDLPAPCAKDDAAKAKAAVEEWKLLKKQIREVAKIQAERLEQAMVTGRRWSAKEFELLLVKHPLMINFVRLVLWGGYDGKGKLATTFRVTEDQTYADSGDEAMKLTGVEQVGIVHPLHLTDEQKRAWGEVFSDYEIVPPFAQIGRPVFALEKDEAKAQEITRFAKTQIPATALVGTLERLAWVRGIPQDAGIFYEHTKPFPGADVTAVVQYEQGVPVGYMEGWEDQKITECFFIPGIYGPKMYPDHKKRLKLGEVDAVALSEVLKDLTLIASKGKE